MAVPKTMKAVVLRGRLKVNTEEVPAPEIRDPRDVIIKVSLAGLCGSDLHQYRGEEPYGFVMGHEVVGEIVETGSAVKKFKIGDKVLSSFCTSCGECSNCQAGWTARCPIGTVPGQPSIAGAQAEYFRLPLADSTLFPVPDDIPAELMLLMADILPTGFSVAMNARMLSGKIETKGVAVVIGCGPVGLCAITSATTMYETVFATDLYIPRLEAAKRHGAIALPLADLEEELSKRTDGQGADAVLEVVGHPSAMVTAMKLARPCGVISSCGVHSREIGLDGEMLYDKNLRLQFGRCSVRTYYPYALEILRQNQELFSTFIEHKVSLDQAQEYYTLFEQNKIAKTVFVP
ncbi:chaperonin 10-like protein [Kockovaella imperatae]|uniref:Chaperonin 10-like protein n=1 Tax=Kockovaella imperatae TaxID=4999 RepID=A0A1Y1UBJ4_9TREE|nr:chaperonin 10-like protein [Kockovaella imperatae]ORX34455.1 chaperonin 10-like protein [Kockovaella imperatae]